jgi:hypothetical protein
VLPVISAFMSKGVPEGEPVVLDVAQLEALLSKTFGIGLDAGRGKEPVALVRLRLARALLGAAEANAVAAEAIAAERGTPSADIAAAEGLALHAAAFNGMPDPVFHLAGRAMTIVTGLAAIEPDPRAPSRDVILDAALQAATGLQQLLSFRHACTSATSTIASPGSLKGYTGASGESASPAARGGGMGCSRCRLRRATRRLSHTKPGPRRRRGASMAPTIRPR